MMPHCIKKTYQKNKQIQGDIPSSPPQITFCTQFNITEAQIQLDELDGSQQINELAMTTKKHHFQSRVAKHINLIYFNLKQ